MPAGVLEVINPIVGILGACCAPTGRIAATTARRRTAVKRARELIE
jgi:hypothetical protein